MTHPLLKGFNHFFEKYYLGDNPLMKKLNAEGQNPNYFIISCIDSRSNPGTIFDALPGTFFAHKAMGAIVRPYQKGTALSAALQFALEYNKVTEIIILGHTGCGAIKALVENLEDEEISSFIQVAKIGLDNAKHVCSQTSCTHDHLLRQSEKEIIRLSAQNLKTYPCIQKALKENRVSIKSWLFDMELGNLLEHDQTTQEFIIIDDTNLTGKQNAKKN